MGYIGLNCPGINVCLYSPCLCSAVNNVFLKPHFKYVFTSYCMAMHVSESKLYNETSNCKASLICKQHAGPDLPVRQMMFGGSFMFCTYTALRYLLFVHVVTTFNQWVIIHVKLLGYY